MESRNPVFNRSKDFTPRGGSARFDTPSVSDLQDLYAAPSATARDTGRMTLDDVVMRTAAMFAVLLATAGFTYFVWQPTTAVPILGAALVGFVLAMVISFSKTIRPPLILAYAAIEGVFVGGISLVYASAFGGGIVVQAVLGTLCAFAAMLVLYRTGVIKATPKFTKMLMIAMVGYLVFAAVNILLSAFHVGGWQSVYSGGGLLPILISAFGVGLASLFLVLDFDFVEQGVRNGLPERYAWTAAFGLVVTLVWLYLEILRLLAILRGND
jgi:uncharacterized YccA/Bax inhibitor family protein